MSSIYRSKTFDVRNLSERATERGRSRLLIATAGPTFRRDAFNGGIRSIRGLS